MWPRIHAVQDGPARSAAAGTKVSIFHTSAAGMFFVGFRGNILWGGPAAAAILTHGLTQRYAAEP